MLLACSVNDSTAALCFFLTLQAMQEAGFLQEQPQEGKVSCCANSRSLCCKSRAVRHCQQNVASIVCLSSLVLLAEWRGFYQPARSLCHPAR